MMAAGRVLLCAWAAHVHTEPVAQRIG
jgi:hypothetical protein